VGFSNPNQSGVGKKRKGIKERLSPWGRRKGNVKEFGTGWRKAKFSSYFYYVSLFTVQVPCLFTPPPPLVHLSLPSLHATFITFLGGE